MRPTIQIVSTIFVLVLCPGSSPLLADGTLPQPVLTGSGDHLPIPTPNPGSLSRVAPLYVDGMGTFSGTWSAPANTAWHGTFSGTGLRPGTSGPGLSSLDFSGLPHGLPIGSIVTLGDLDAGSDPLERITMQAFDAMFDPLELWLDFPSGVSSAGSSTDTPAWDWSAQTYTFSGDTVPGNPSVNLHMKTNQVIHHVQISRETGGFGYAIDAPSFFFCDGFESGSTNAWDVTVPGPPVSETGARDEV